MKTRTLALPSALLLALSLTACGDDDDTTPDAASGSPDAAALTVEVAYGDLTNTVTLSTLTPGTFGGVAAVKLSDVVLAAFPSVTVANLQADDFVASDGFASSGSSNCTEVLPIDGASFDKGWIEIATRNLVWEDSLGFPGCTSPDDLVTVKISDVAAAGPSVDVTYGGTTNTVVLSTVTAGTFGGAAAVKVSDVILAAFPSVTVDSLQADDFIAGDGFAASSSGNCAPVLPLDGASLAQGWIAPDTRNLGWEEALDLPGCLGVDDLATIQISDK